MCMLPTNYPFDYTLQEGGARALYRGFGATVCGMIPYAGLSFFCFEQIKLWFMTFMPSYTCKPCEKNTGECKVDA